MAHRSRHWIVIGLLACGALPVAAGLRITEEEANSFMTAHYGALERCDVQDINRQLAPEASLRVRYSRFPDEAFTKAEYLRRFPSRCRPYVTYAMDTISYSVSIASDHATVLGKGTWGARQQQIPVARSLVKLRQRTELARRGSGLVITEMNDEYLELVPGGEERLRSYQRSGALFQGAVKWYRGVIEMAQDLWSKRRRSLLP